MCKTSTPLPQPISISLHSHRRKRSCAHVLVHSTLSTTQIHTSSFSPTGETDRLIGHSTISILVHRFFTACSQIVLSLFTACSKHDINNTCSLFLKTPTGETDHVIDRNTIPTTLYHSSSITPTGKPDHVIDRSTISTTLFHSSSKLPQEKLTA